MSDFELGLDRELEHLKLFLLSQHAAALEAARATRQRIQEESARCIQLEQPPVTALHCTDGTYVLKDNAVFKETLVTGDVTALMRALMRVRAGLPSSALAKPPRIRIRNRSPSRIPVSDLSGPKLRSTTRMAGGHPRQSRSFREPLAEPMQEDVETTDGIEQEQEWQLHRIEQEQTAIEAWPNSPIRRRFTKKTKGADSRISARERKRVQSARGCKAYHPSGFKSRQLQAICVEVGVAQRGSNDAMIARLRKKGFGVSRSLGQALVYRLPELLDRTGPSD